MVNWIIEVLILISRGLIKLGFQIGDLWIGGVLNEIEDESVLGNMSIEGLKCQFD